MRRVFLPLMGGLLILAGVGATGCIVGENAEDAVEALSEALDEFIEELQELDPRVVVLPPGFRERGDQIVIDDDVEIIDDVLEDLDDDDLASINLLGFENLTGFDVFISFEADGEFQGILVFDGETLLLEYDCLTDVNLLGQDNFDVESGVFVEGFDFSDALFLNPDDFLCGDGIILTLEAGSADLLVDIFELDNP